MRVTQKVRSLGRGIPPWAKPSMFVAGTGVAAATIELVFTPLPNGDNWIDRVADGYGAYVASGKTDPTLILARDPGGNNVFTILGAQIKQNALGAAFTAGSFGVGAAILKRFGL